MTSLAVSEDRLRDIAAPYGGIDAMNYRMAQHKKAFARLNQDWELLLAQYPDRWVAVGPDGVLATASSQQELLAGIRAREENVGEFVTEYLNTSNEVLIL